MKLTRFEDLECLAPLDNMFYVYILKSERDHNFYTGHTKNLKKRLEEHNKGINESTKLRRPLRLIYYEACLNKKDAIHREKYLKTSWGKRFIKTRLNNYLRSI
jgi:putative endonuclease